MESKSLIYYTNSHNVEVLWDSVFQVRIIMLFLYDFVYVDHFYENKSLKTLKKSAHTTQMDNQWLALV